MVSSVDNGLAAELITHLRSSTNYPTRARVQINCDGKRARGRNTKAIIIIK
jgi:hypothetical protein